MIAVAQSCNTDKHENAVARVYNDYLYRSDLEGIVPKGSTQNDSIEIINEYLTNWIKHKLELKQAERNLSKNQKDFSKQLENYRNSLIIYTYESELIKQKLDTTVTDKEIATYYENNKENFSLKDNIVKVIYVKLLKSAPINKFRPLVRNFDEPDRKKLEDLCTKYAVNSFLDDSKWLLFYDILKEIPIKTYDQEEYLNNNRFIEIQDSLYIYLLNIKGFMIKESVSPLSFEKNNIRNIIINKRKLELIENVKNSIFKDAKDNNDFEIFQ